MRRFRSANGLVMAVICLCAWSLVTPAHAAEPGPAASSGGGVTISPAVQDITLTQSNTNVSFDFTVTNNTATSQDFELSVTDFGSLDDTGGLLFVGLGDKTLKDYKYGLSAWAKPGQKRITVAAKKDLKVPIIITNDDSLAPGGHYGAILVRPVSASGQVAAKVQIDQIASALLLVKKQGGEKYALGLDSYKVDGSLFDLPFTVDMRFHNTGNVHTTPRGVVSITDARGKVVRRGVINPESAIILPDSYRQISTPLMSISNSLVPGRYRMTVAYRLDTDANLQIEAASIIYVNGAYAVGGVLLVGIIILLAFNRRIRRNLVLMLKSPTRLFKQRSKSYRRR